MARRFNEVTVNAPSPKDTLEILKGIAKLYEKHHHVSLPEDVLKAAVDYAVQYIPQRSLPDKAIDLLDMTAAHLSAKNPVTDKVSLEKQMTDVKAKQEKAVSDEDYEAALKYKNQIADLEKKINSAEDATKLWQRQMMLRNQLNV